MNTTPALGHSVFNYDLALMTDVRLIHYGHQYRLVMGLQPQRVLEIGPGDHTVTDMLRRRGVEVKTLDNDAALNPDYLGDMRQPFDSFGVHETFDTVLASEVFEHMNFRFLPPVLEHIRAVLEPGGYLVVGLPYSTIRLFPTRRDFGWPVSCEGRLQTHLPFAAAQRIMGWLKGQREPKAMIPHYPDDKFDTHHWDTGYYPTTLPPVRAVFSQVFTITEETILPAYNSAFWVLQR